MSMVVQTVRVSNLMPRTQASKMVREMGYKAPRADKIKNPQYANFHSFRQIDPAKFVKGSFRTKVIKKKPEVFVVMGKLK